MIKNHQFHKVEINKIVKPEESEKEAKILLGESENILRKLELPYRVVKLCTGDLSFSVAKGYDIEVWMPHVNEYVEISSTYNKRDFSARRANIKYLDDKTEDLEYVHMVSGSGLAVGRTVAAILENYQNKDGSVSVPDVLVPYMRGVKTIQ